MGGEVILLLQLDGKLPNLALMRLAAHYRALGRSVKLQYAGNEAMLDQVVLDRVLGSEGYDEVYASLIFERTRPLAQRLVAFVPRAVIGGTGWDVGLRLEDLGVTTQEQDYSVYPGFRASIGFTQRGCRLRCPFCVVPRKEGANMPNANVAQIWRGGDHPRELLLLDNDFFGQTEWRERIKEIRSGGFKVCLNQGINARLLDDESAAALASVDYRDDAMKGRRIYTAWDSRKDERRFFIGLELLVRHGVKPRNITVYMLVGFEPGETHEDRDYRRLQLRQFGAVPYPMAFERTPELTGFQRWVIGAYDKSIPWAEWSAARYRPENLRRRLSPSQARQALMQRVTAEHGGGGAK